MNQFHTALFCTVIATCAATPAHAGLVYTYSSAVGTANAFASVPGGVPQTAGVPYDFSFNPSVLYTRNFTAGSQVAGEGVALATATSWTTINRGDDFLFAGIFDGVSVSSTNSGGTATASTSADHEYRFTVNAAGAGPWSYSYSLSTAANNPATQFARVTFGVVGGVTFVDEALSAANLFSSSGGNPITLVPGTIYRLTLTSSASASVNGLVSAGLDGEARTSFSMSPVPAPSASGLFLAAGLTLCRRRRRQVAPMASAS